ncbi:anti-phage defense-associated sirtuin Dsr2 [Desulfatibacillum aliphaticivorans]|uniref:anti-phage defense-associated sirtuin Dsr2 n=1 Tax=Desulfatibacillum aliphaticivorans TaxID=218208 RepID=UPI0004120BDF|nr:anti-phage defense-associated sirtuin Dsr2 [Desulfatibacillum aliphaticivorans]
MDESKFESIPENIKPYLNEIADRLQSEQAAVMVGAGFSKNATPNSPACSGFPDWNELGDTFYLKARGKKVDYEQRYLNAMRLAGEVQATLGRPALNELLKKSIPDEEYEPSNLHKMLLELRWTDIFTTNYDTLLERARALVPLKKYDLVVNKEDLINANKPRIIKLHGSFPSERPFVITEEDYRRYPTDYAPFVNTVQQSLLENTLCLIGFSGDDPNFLQWIGWIRDNLGPKNTPKIYLVGVLNLSEAQKRLLCERDIVAVDLSQCPEVHGDYQKGLKFFLNFLSRRQTEDDPLEWPRDPKFMFADSKKNKVEQLNEVLPVWQTQRLYYPGWVIVPEDNRKSLWIYTNSWIKLIPKNDELPGFMDLEYAYELNWRMEKCLCPLNDSQAEFFQNILNKYMERYLLNNSKVTLPIPSSSDADCFSERVLNKSEIEDRWFSLSISVMRFYREEGLINEWSDTERTMQRLAGRLSPEQIACLGYECCLFALSILDIPELKKRLSDWPINESLPFFEVKRAALLIEIGETSNAKEIIESSLKRTRSLLNQKPISDDYSLASQESIVMLIYDQLKSALDFSYDNEPPTADEEELARELFLLYRNDQQKAQGNEDISKSILVNPKYDFDHITPESEWESLKADSVCSPKSYYDHWIRKAKHEIRKREKREARKRRNDLKKYRCDPKYELKIFDIGLQERPIEKPAQYSKKYFDIGVSVPMIRFRGESPEILDAYAFLRFCEDTGIPFKIRNMSVATTSAAEALHRVSKYSPYWGQSIMMRLGDDKAIERLFSRDVLHDMRVSVINSYIDRYLESFKNNMDEFQKGTPLALLLPRMVPEILSRLCCKCSTESKHRIFDFLLRVYQSNHKNKYSGVRSLLDRLLSSFSIRERYSLIPKLLDFPIPTNIDSYQERDFLHPFLFLHVEKGVNIVNKAIPVSKERITSLIDGVSSLDTSERKWAICSLKGLYDLHLLEPEQENYFSKALWERVDDTGFPVDTGLFKFVHLILPYPKNTDVVSLFKEYVQGASFSVQGSAGGSITIVGWNCPLCSELLGAKGHIQWTEEEILSIFYRLVEWWDADKDYLKTDDKPTLFGSKASEFTYRFKKLMDVLVAVISPNISSDISKEISTELSRVIKEMGEYDLSTLRLESAFAHVLNQPLEELFAKIYGALVSSNQEVVIDGLKAVLAIFENLELNGIEESDLFDLLRLLGQMVLWRKNTALFSALTAVRGIVADSPGFFSGAFEIDVLTGLENIASDPIDDYLDFADWLAIRREAASLAYCLYSNYIKQENEVPPQIIQWQEICRSEDEFAEIQNQWLE